MRRVGSRDRARCLGRAFALYAAWRMASASGSKVLSTAVVEGFAAAWDAGVAMRT